MKLQYRNLKMIVCVAKDNLIGSSSPKGNGLLWHSTEELKYFKKITMGNTLIFGKKTAMCIPINLMKKDREIIVLDYGMDIYKILEDNKQKNIFVCGGYSVYKYFLENYVFSEIYISKLKDHVEIKKEDNLLYLPNLEDFGYEKINEVEYNDFYAMVYRRKDV